MQLREMPLPGDWPVEALDGLSLSADTGLAPVVTAVLQADRSVLCRQDALAWKEPTLRLATYADVPDMVAVQGPGRFAVSSGRLGAVFPLRLAAGEHLHIRTGHLLLATAVLRYTLASAQGVPIDPRLDTYTAAEKDALLLLQGYGSVTSTILGEEESLDVAQGALLYAEPCVTLEIVSQRLGTAAFGAPTITLVRCSGPGGIGIQSLVEPISAEIRRASSFRGPDQ